MAFLSWRRDYEIGIKEVDVEHRKLFDLVNEYYDKHYQGAGQKDIQRILNQLVAYAEEHFKNEEALMEAHSYPRLDEHRQQHEQLFLDVFKINESLSNDPGRVDRMTLQFLKKWLTDHIVQDDVDIGYFIRMNEAKSK